ncbi:hypothetical protein TTHERM_00069350 (macronuclear) [Tetrahymena thermophila SB210]|uniref:Uncharacterized protein n=1 Tax=Tetrahymena thermophila (strain SB210) TaxID=312017 RepID=I7LTY5_TETTS|nr:hypothetical protein TTHERM_00069350 [Tetrahymena thermophila SB210]EAR87528.2 hypothetical protein TTHERM_00069350 [Tetrahymena thermophila SB210]|eukprot:XP_001007773.2 hypothetical protein TTHERM_00069350 [Tetrahymena thermophila SB210]
MEVDYKNLISVKNPCKYFGQLGYNTKQFLEYLRRPVKLPQVFIKTFQKSNSPDNPLSKNSILNRSLESARKQLEEQQSSSIQNKFIIRKSSSKSPQRLNPNEKNNVKLNKAIHQMSPTYNNLNSSFEIDKQQENSYIYYNQANQVLQSEQLRREIYPIRTIPYLPKQAILKSPPKYKIKQADIQTKEDSFFDNIQMGMDTLQEQSSQKEDTSQEEDSQIFITNNQNSYSNVSSVKSSFDQNKNQMGSTKKEQKIHKEVSLNTYQQSLKKQTSILISNKSILDSEIQIKQQSDISSSEIDSKHLLYLPKQEKEVVQKKNQLQQIQPTQNETSSEKIEYISSHFSQYSPKNQKFQNKVDTQGFSSFYDKQVNQRYSIEKTSDSVIQSQNQIANQNQRKQKTLKQFFQGVLKMIGPIIAFRKQSIKRERARTMPKKKTIFNKDNQRHSNLGILTSEFIKSNSLVNSNDELELFDNIKQDKTLINIDLNKKNPNQKRYSNMYTYQSLLEIKIQNMNLNKQLLFNKIETFDEEAANKLVQDGLNIKNIELEANIVENDLTPEAWIKKIQNMNLPYQARCLFYKDKKYVWEKVNILEYSEEKMKYLVEFIEGGQKKFVNRNVIAFRFEKMENIISRIETIISKSKLVQDEKKFQIFVSKVDDSLVENMQSEQKQRIFNLCLRQDYLKNVKKKILSEAILHQMSQEVDKLYKHKMKEILVIYQMQKPEFQEYFYKEADLEPRLLYAPSFPFMTSIYRSENFAQITKYFLLKRNVFLKNECQKSLSQVQNINIQFGMKPAFDIQIETIKPPKNIDQLIKIQKESIDNMRIRLITNYRENMIHEIFDKLQKFYKFFETDIDKYRNSLLFRFLKRVEFQIVESLGENVFKHNCFIWLKFLQSFTYPEIKLLSQENNKIKNSTLTQEEIDFQVKQIKLSEVWVCNNKQLLNLRVVCTDQGKIAFQPAFEEIFQQLCQPIHMLNEMVNSFQKLEKTVVPLLDFDLPETYKIDHGPYVNTVKDFIFSFIQAQWDTYLTPIVEKYSQFSHFFLEESTQVFQIFKEGSEMNQNFSISVFLLDAQLYSQSNKQKVSQNQPQQNQSNKSWITSQVQNVQNQQNANYISNNFGAQSNNLNVTNNFVQKSNQKIFEKGLANILLDMTIVRESGNIYSLNQLKDTNRIREILRKLHEDIQKAKMLECDIVKTPLFFINVQPCKKNTVFFGMNAKTTILKSIAFIIQQNIGTLQESFEHFKLKISKYPTNEEELVQSKIIISGCESDIENFQTEIKNIGQYIDLIEEFYFQMNPTTWEAYWMLYTCPQLVREKLQQSKQVIAQQEKKFIDSLDKERQLLQLKIENIFQDFQTVKNFNNYQLAKDYCMEAQSLNEQINDAIYQGQQINKREQLLQLQLTKYVLLEQIKQQSIYFIKLWELAFQLQIDRHKWMLGSLMKISFEQFKQKILEYDHNKEEIKVKIQELVEDKSIIKVIQEIQKDIDQSREISWMIEYLTTEAMIKKPQFFKDLFRECNLPMIEPNEDMSLKALIDVDLIHFRDQIRECSERADNVFNTEKQLQQIQDRLKETLLELIEYRETFIISNLSNLQKIIVEQNNSIQEIKNSEREKLAPKYTQEIDQKVQSVSFNIGKIQEFQQLYVQAGNIIDTIEYEKKTNSLMKPFHQSESFWRGVIRFVRENNSLFETDFNFDYDNQIQSLQKFILQFKDDKKQTDN